MQTPSLAHASCYCYTIRAGRSRARHENRRILHPSACARTSIRPDQTHESTVIRGQHRSLGSQIDAEDADEIRDFFQMSQGVAGTLIVAAQDIDEEYVFPWPAAHRTRLDLAQADIA